MSAKSEQQGHSEEQQQGGGEPDVVDEHDATPPEDAEAPAVSPSPESDDVVEESPDDLGGTGGLNAGGAG